MIIRLKKGLDFVSYTFVSYTQIVKKLHLHFVSHFLLHIFHNLSYTTQLPNYLQYYVHDVTIDLITM